MMAKQRGLDVHVYDHTQGGAKPQLVRDLGAEYHTGETPPGPDLAPDVVLECTGVPSVVLASMNLAGPSGIVCLAGLSSGSGTMPVPLGALNMRMVLGNETVFGSVNANRRHFEAGAEALAAADRGWLARVISRKVPIDQWKTAFARQPDDIKVVIEFPG
jgi:threonine dehydrogenase-like Zn-dependent dehydrogenase